MRQERWLLAEVTPSAGNVDVAEAIADALRRRNCCPGLVLCGHVLYPLWPRPARDEPISLLVQFWSN